MKNIIILISIFLINASGCKSKKADTLPDCVQEIIEGVSSDEYSRQPIKVYQYTYNDEKVFYITYKCCDIPSSLYNENCDEICSPDGGITGKGDGKCADFFDTRSDEKLIWEDKSK